MKRILLLGATGFVGSRLQKYFETDYQVFSPTRSEIDLYDLSTFYPYISQIKPDYILHMAALSDTKYCQQHKEESWKINVIATQEIAKAAAENGAKMIFMSSDQVYNGTKELGLLSEEVELNPISIYGYHKLEAENRILSIDLNTVILRATWMYDLPSSLLKNNNNLLIRLMEAVKHRTKVVLPVREFRGITWVRQVIENFSDFLDLPGGIYNMGSENKLNTYETAKVFLKLMGHEKLIDEILIPDRKNYIEFPRNLSISIDKLRSFGILFDCTEEGIKNCIR